MLLHKGQDVVFWHSRQPLPDNNHIKAGALAGIEEINFVRGGHHHMTGLLQGRSTSLRQCLVGAGIEDVQHPLSLSLCCQRA